MIERLYNKLCVGLRLQEEIIAAGLPVDPSQGARFYGVFTVDSATNPYTKVLLYNDITQQETDIVDTVVANHIPTPIPPAPDHPYDSEGKPYVRAESRPINCTTYFTTCADNGSIGNGKRFAWDFSNTDDDITAPSGCKKKRLEFSFIDTVWMKEGTVYYKNALKGSYFDQYIVCPTGYYYYKNDGTIALAAEDTVVSHYVIKHPMQGDVPMGDELNSESCSGGIPSYYKFRIEIVVPDTDSTSNGVIEIEMYRERTVILT